MGATHGVKSPAVTAALTLGLTGKYWRQGTGAAEGVRLRADEAGIRLTLVNDHSSTAGEQLSTRSSLALLRPSSAGSTAATHRQLIPGSSGLNDNLGPPLSDSLTQQTAPVLLYGDPARIPPADPTQQVAEPAGRQHLQRVVGV
jgi:hypothetical protein